MALNCPHVQIDSTHCLVASKSFVWLRLQTDDEYILPGFFASDQGPSEMHAKMRQFFGPCSKPGTRDMLNLATVPACTINI